MHPTSSANLGNVTASEHWPIVKHPGSESVCVRIGRGTYPLGSYADVSAAYCATIGRLGLGVSQTPACELLDAAGNVVAQVAYNGRVFAVGADGEPDNATVLYEPYNS